MIVGHKRKRAPPPLVAVHESAPFEERPWTLNQQDMTKRAERDFACVSLTPKKNQLVHDKRYASEEEEEARRSLFIVAPQASLFFKD